MPVEIIRYDSSNQEAWKVNIDKLKEDILKPRGGNIKPIRHPRLVMSVVGDSSSFLHKPWLTPVLQLGLIETAKGAKDCVILYKGSNERVSRLVGKAVDDFDVMNRQKAKKECGDEKNLTFISLIGLQPDVKEKKGSPKDSVSEGTEGENRVNKENQTSKSEDTDTKNNNAVVQRHFKLKDRHRLKDYEMKMKSYGKFYAEVLESVAKEYVPLVELDCNLLMNVPVVVLVAEGDLHTLDVVVEVLKKCIPVVILQGSGKAADLIAECMEDMESIEAKAPLLFGIYFCQGEFHQLKSCMVEIQKRKHFVTIFDITKHDETEFSDVVVNSIISGWAHGKKTEDREITKVHDDIIIPPSVSCSENNSGTNRNTKNGKSTKRNSIQPEAAVPLKLRVEEVKIFMRNYEKSLTPASLPLYFYIACQFIQKTYFNKNDLKEENFKILLKQAIIANRVDYVAVLLEEENVDFRKEDFPKIYEVIECGCDSDGNCHHIKSILKGESAKATDILFGNRKVNGDGVIEAGRQLCQKFLHYPKIGRNQKKDEPEAYKQDIYQDLLIWSLFANRPQMATLFWMKCENQLLTAILARCLLRKMAETVRSGKDRFLFDAFTEHESVFEKRAIDLQTKLYEEDPEVAMELMLADQTVWDIHVTPLDCAYDNIMLDFIAHSCAQRKLNKIWYKGIGTGFGDFFKNGCLRGCKRQKVNEEEELMLFRFLYAPLTRFLVHYIIFLAVMVCFSAFLLIDLKEYNGVKSIEIYEFIVYVWLLGDIYEEYRGIVTWKNEVMKSKFSHGKTHLSSQSTWFQLKRYIYDFWNSLDVLFYCITIVAIFVRILSTNLKHARRLYSLSLFMMYMRFLHALVISRSLGPKIIMIKGMLNDLFRFIGILFVFMMGVGVLYHANMYPAHRDFWSKEGWEYWRIWKVMYYPYWQIYGELFLDKFKGNTDGSENCTDVQSDWESNPDIERCIQYDWVVTFISALYMLMSNLLLVNLIIALFSYRFEIVQNNSEKLWRYWRYAVIMDYRHRLPSPMNLVIRPLVLVYKGIKKHSKVKKSGIKKRLEQAKSNDVDEIKRMKRIQSISANKCIRQEL